ncbi:diiron oxygenase [Sorangium sp. So ce1000]|uniref:diiron oxygenase n=1 Tax=Sorangium sp. So ce1000 TaxID=3133325 RepID=UPI003F62D7BD
MSEILAESWANRVAVRTSTLDLSSYYDKTAPDYPAGMVPFRDDPRYRALDAETQRRVLAAAWVAYNEKTISVEMDVVEPACGLLLRGAFAGIDTSALKRSVAQTLVDEQFHVLMCLEGCLVAREAHNIQTLRFPKPLVVEELEREKARCERPRDAELVQLAFATVAEVTINAYLDLLANDQTIQALNREMTALHRKDESSHRKLFNEFTKALFACLDDDERAVYLRGIAMGLEAFVRVDLGAWAAILDHLEIPEASDIIQRCLEASASRRIVRDFSGFRLLLRDIGVKEADVAFQFDAG